MRCLLTLLIIILGLIPAAAADLPFETRIDYAVGENPWKIGEGDFNGDGHRDMVTSNYESSTISILLNTGDGSFLPAIDVAVGEDPTCLFIGDLF